MSANDVCLIVEMLPDQFNVYHVDFDDFAHTGRRGRSVYRHISLRAAFDWANEQGAEYGPRVQFLTPEKRRLLG